MERVRRGDRQAFQKLYEKYRRPIMSFLSTMIQDSAVVDELFQETFLKLYRARESYEKRAKFSTFLWTIAKHTAFDWLEKKKEFLFEPSENEDGSAGPQIEEILESDLPHAEQALIEKMDEHAISECMSRLSDPEKLLCALRMHSELSYEEIAEQTKLPIGTVKTKLFRIREKLAKSFQAKSGGKRA